MLYIKGEVAPEVPFVPWVGITYQPYKYSTFVTTDCQRVIVGAQIVLFKEVLCLCRLVTLER